MEDKEKKRGKLLILKEKAKEYVSVGSGNRNEIEKEWKKKDNTKMDVIIEIGKRRYRS